MFKFIKKHIAVIAVALFAAAQRIWEGQAQSMPEVFVQNGLRQAALRFVDVTS